MTPAGGGTSAVSAGLRLVFLLNLGFTLLELVGGLWTNSLAIISGAVHDLGDTLSLGLAWYLDKYAEKGRDRQYSYGYRRFWLLSALANTLVITTGSLFVWFIVVNFNGEVQHMIVFGPVPSRRLGRSLGINNIPPKACTYSCVYCQVGRTMNTQLDRHAFYRPKEIASEVENRVRVVREQGEPIDYLTFVANGEPTLDINLGREIDLLRPLGIRIAVITNASLVWRSDVAEDLRRADWVSLKVDTVREDVWRKLNRPKPFLEFMDRLAGMIGFAKGYGGELATETMLVKGLNDVEEQLELLADFLLALKPAKAYLAIPTRPPVEPWVETPDERVVNRAFQILSRKVEQVELITGYEGNAFACTGNVAEDLLDITAVHPMREEAVRELLTKAGGDWAVVKKLIDTGLLTETEYEGRKYYLKSFGREV